MESFNSIDKISIDSLQCGKDNIQADRSVMHRFFQMQTAMGIK